MSKSAIEWTDETDNVFIVWDTKQDKQAGWYCVRVSPGCKNCYAAAFNVKGRFNLGNGMDYRVQKFPPHLRLTMRRDIMEKWTRQRKPRRHFVNSMTDTFADFYPVEWIFELFDFMEMAPNQTFQVLTKRADRMADVVAQYLNMRRGESDALGRVTMHPKRKSLPVNVHVGVSVENQEWADKRIPYLLQVNAAVRFLSVEPLLGPVNISPYLPHLQWVIVGGESGPDARPIHPAWVQSIKDQCKTANVPFFFKQWGEWDIIRKDTPVIREGEIVAWRDPRRRDAYGVLAPDGTWYDGHTGWNGRPIDPDTGEAYMVKVGKKVAGRLLDGRTWDQFPEVVIHG